MGRRSRFGGTIAVIAIFVIAAGACGGGGGNSNASAGGGGGGGDTRISVPEGGVDDPERTDIAVVNFAYEPEPFTTTAGSTVWWVNEGSATHTVNSDEFGDGFTGSGTIRTGKGFSYTFDTPGEYAYFCNNHPGMEGTIIVE